MSSLCLSFAILSLPSLSRIRLSLLFSLPFSISHSPLSTIALSTIHANITSYNITGSCQPGRIER